MLLVVTTFGRLFTKTRKRSVPKIDPCGTSLVTGNSGDFFFQLSHVGFDCPDNFSQCQLSYLEFQLTEELPGCVYGPACQKFWQSQCTPLQGTLSESPGFCKFHLSTLRIARGWNASEQNRTDKSQLSEDRFQQWFSRSFSPNLWICYRGVILVYLSLPVIDPYL